MCMCMCMRMCMCMCVCGCVVSVYVCVYTSGEGSYDDPIRVALLQSSNLYHTLLARSASSSMIMSFWEPLRGWGSVSLEPLQPLLIPEFRVRVRRKRMGDYTYGAPLISPQVPWASRWMLSQSVASTMHVPKLGIQLPSKVSNLL